jgi:hypothetical protein
MTLHGISIGHRPGINGKLARLLERIQRQQTDAAPR